MTFTIEEQTQNLIGYIKVSAKRGRSEDEIIAWGKAPDYKRIIETLEDRGIVYRTAHLFSGIRYYTRRGRQ